MTASPADLARRQADAIAARVRPPRFPDREFPVTDHGAVGDGITDCTAAIAGAIAACHAAGGGHVIVPEGTYTTGAVRLLSGVDLHLHAGATLAFSRDPAAYLPPVLTRFQGVETYGYSPLVYAHGQRNIAVTGAGVLDGRADPDHWWPWSGQEEFGWRPGMPQQEDDWPRLWAQAERGDPVAERVYATGHHFRPNFLETYDCENVLVEGVTFVRSPMWVMHPVLCRNVLVQNVTVDSIGPNNDGCDPESCRDVVIRGCVFNAGDDCIAVKSGREADGRRVNVPSENILIEDCVMLHRYGAITLGSDMTGGIRNVFARRCRIGGPGLYFGLYIKTNSVRGGFAENVQLDDLSVTHLTKEFLTCDFHRGEGDTGDHPPHVGDIGVRNVTVGQARRALLARGYPHAPIRGLRLADCSFAALDEADRLEHVEGLVLEDVSRPEPTQRDEPHDAT
ncbi:glycoside hydrolase family 28 protein [Streptomyces johnsoniae]|uniref:Glycoside hydrolase family 28 protein n=1 Tax=Streptomyces johnsoniae TaxID=3075532 RepID=A0ABU2S8I4_9ACTN|nr:glycoside hydrolase family 28 protein [Streptomyces sp. DSM 41886]MDT0444724.1 glycoside hydrolase family 28 protein [Streptomyces sp. DSM 41886]